jgi:hypothetical protein
MEELQLQISGIMPNKPKKLHTSYRSLGIVMSYGLDTWGSIPDRGKRYFSSPRYPDQI